MSKCTREWCIRHGHQDFFLGMVDVDGMEGEALHCPLCFPEHEDNPAVIERQEADAEKQLNCYMAL